MHSQLSKNHNILKMTENGQLYMDATFKSCPQPYNQMFAIQGDYHGRVLPFVTVLMTKSTIGDYRHALQAIKRKEFCLTGHNWDPMAIVVDFEQSLITAVETELPNTRTEMCYFHFNQSLWHRIQELGLARAYKRDDNLQQIMRKVMALGFLPLALVRNNVALLRNSRDTRRKIFRYPALLDF